jgi:hypothetical protein
VRPGSGKIQPGALKDKEQHMKVGMNKTLAAIALGASLTTLGGCNDAISGGAAGAGLGALAGMGLGSLSGNMGKGAAAGAIIGGLGGAILGDQNARAGSRVDYYGGYGYRSYGYREGYRGGYYGGGYGGCDY